MEARLKAKELVDKYYYLFSIELENTIDYRQAKQCSLIAVDEILEVIPNEVLDIWKGETYMALNENVSYWEQVKQEIKNL